jgi:hypothetical protein
MPDAFSLYPQPPQAAAQGLLQGDPLKLIGALQGIQSYQLQQQQIPALAKQPGATLQGTYLSNRGTQIQNDTALLQQRDAQRKIVANAFGTALTGMENPTADDVHNLTTYLSKLFPDIPARVFNETASLALRHPQGIRYGAGMLLNTGLSPEAASARVPGPPDAVTGAPTDRPVTAANLPSAAKSVVGLPPGSSTSAEVYQRDLVRAGNFKQDIYPLERALELAKKLGPGGMAPGSKTRQDFESMVYGMMPSLVPEAMKEKIKNYAELEKYLVQNASQRAQNLGPHTNEGLAAATTGSPNVHINDLAGIDLIKAQIALRKMEHAQTLQAARSGPANYTLEKGKFSAGQDPRAYALETMEPEQIQNLTKSLKGAERDQFIDSLEAAVDSGAVKASPEVVEALKKRKAKREPKSGG